eukprot:3672006-Rhodomonas_salina.1
MVCMPRVAGASKRQKPKPIRPRLCGSLRQCPNKGERCQQRAEGKFTRSPTIMHIRSGPVEIDKVVACGNFRHWPHYPQQHHSLAE